MQPGVIQLWLLDADGSHPQLLVAILSGTPQGSFSAPFGYYGQVDFDGVFTVEA